MGEWEDEAEEAKEAEEAEEAEEERAFDLEAAAGASVAGEAR